MTALVFGNQFIKVIQEHFGALENYNIISSILAEFTFIFVTFIIFLLLYKFMPRHKVSFKVKFMVQYLEQYLLMSYHLCFQNI